MVLSKDSEDYKKMKALIAKATEDGRDAYGDDWEAEYLPFKEHKDKNEESGEYEVVNDKVDVVFRASAKRMDKATRKKKIVKLTIYDQYGDLWDHSQKVTGGSTIQVSYETNPYLQVAGKNTIQGIQFRMNGVKVIELGGGGDAKGDFEFDEKPEVVASTSSNPDCPDDPDDDSIPF
jgi:hypothetical protein